MMIIIIYYYYYYCIFFSGFYVAAVSVIATFNVLPVNYSVTSSQKELPMFRKQ